MSKPPATLPAPPFQVALDEFGYYAGGDQDHLKRAVRAVPGVPDAAYLVRNGRVFVFARLLELVQDSPRVAGRLPSLRPDGVRLLMQEAWMTPHKAVAAYSVVPRGYCIDVDANEGWTVVRSAFDAVVPGGTGRGNEGLHRMLAALLVGDRIDGPGDFSYRGQPLALRTPFTLDGLPPRPALVGALPAEVPYRYTQLRHVAYEQGFAPLSPALFERARVLETSWGEETAVARALSHARIADAWAIAATQVLPHLEINDPGEPLDDEAVWTLRVLYPELADLATPALSFHYGAFQHEMGNFRRWYPLRDENFLFYLLAQMVDLGPGLCRDRVLGEILAFGLLEGRTMAQAQALARQWYDYDRALGAFAERVAKVLAFLAGDRQWEPGVGPSVTTFGDVAGMARSEYWHMVA